ncbi:MFS transporter [Bacillus smithii]|uniref:MDR family MFS transporter n=1 Tax=Bacillus smithii TaxID=1479 RepID=UPI002E1D66A2|nr:MFS transporter [Bacillus smithii]
MKEKRLQIHPLGWNIILGTLFGRMSTSMSIPFLAIYLTQVKHLSPTVTGMIIAASSLVGIVSSFYGGFLSDFLGRKTVLLISIFSWSLVFVGFFFADKVIAFFVLNALNGLCQSIFEPSSKALLSDISKEENRLQIFNLRYTAINMGVVFGPILGLKLGSAESTFPFLIAGFIYFIYGMSLVYSFSHYTIDTKDEKEEKIKLSTAFHVTRKDTVFLAVLLGIILSISGYSQFSSTLPQYFAEQMKNGVKLFSLFLSLNAIVVIIVQYPIVKVMNKFHPLNSIILGNIFISLSLLSFSFTSNPLILSIIVIFFTIGEVMMFTMTDLLVDHIAKPGLKGTYFGAIGFNRLGNVIGPWLGGLLLESFGVHHSFYMFLIIFITTISGIPALMFSRNKLKKMSALKNTVSADKLTI